MAKRGAFVGNSMTLPLRCMVAEAQQGSGYTPRASYWVFFELVDLL